MDYKQESIATLHNIAGSEPDSTLDSAAIIVPMLARELEGQAARRLLSSLEATDVGRVFVPFCAPADDVSKFRRWLDGYDLPIQPLWCSGPELAGLLEEYGLAESTGKGRDVWLAAGIAAAEYDYVIQNDADVKNYTTSIPERLVFPLLNGYEFSKGYYVRTSENRFFGRLFRLFYSPLTKVIADSYQEPVTNFLVAFRYALSGEFGMTADMVGTLTPQPHMGFAVGTLGNAFEYAGFDGTAQVDLGTHEHFHRPVEGSNGLVGMSADVGEAIFHVLEDRGLSIDYARLRQLYRETALQFVDRYETDSAFNSLDYDPHAEREQVSIYSESVREPADDRRLPSWDEASISPDEVFQSFQADMNTSITL